MAVVKQVVFQIVGYQDRGKTTVTSKLIKALKDLGLKTATIKHHGHGGKPDAPDGKDTGKHLEAGALASIVEGGGRLILQADDYPVSLNDQINLIQHFQTDVILIEGFKLEGYPKLVLLRDEADLDLLLKVTNVKVIMYWDKSVVNFLKGKNIPIFQINDQEAIDLLAKAIKDHVKQID